MYFSLNLGSTVYAAESSSRGSISRGRTPRSVPVGLTIPKTPLHGVAGHTLLALHKCHSALFPGPREADVGSLDGATLLLAEVPMEALAVWRRGLFGWL